MLTKEHKKKQQQENAALQSEFAEALKYFSETAVKWEQAYKIMLQRYENSVKELEKKNQELQHAQRLASLGQLSAGVAHEIRNPLAGIELSATLLMRSLEEEKDKDIANNIVVGVSRINSIVMNLLTISKGSKLHKSNVCLVNLLKQSVNAIKMDKQNDKVKINLQILDEDIQIYADAGQLRQVFINIIQNGIDACQQEKKVDIIVEKTQDKCLIDIKDYGVGLSEEDKEKLFNPFYTTKEKGTGLGLAISHRIIEDHLGKISVTSKEGEGAKFSVELPYEDQ